MRLSDIEPCHIDEGLIGDIKVIGDPEGFDSRFNKLDKRLIQRYQQDATVLRKAFEKVPCDCRVFICGSKDLPYIGQVNRQFLEKVLANPKEVDMVLTGHENAITLIYASNSTDPEYKSFDLGAVPFTPWMVLHRAAHAMDKSKIWKNYALDFQRTINTTLSKHYGIRPHEDLYIGVGKDKIKVVQGSPDSVLGNHHSDFGSIYLELMAEIGTVRSARNKTIQSTIEYCNEMFAQYCMQGKVSLNPLPKTFTATVYDNSFENPTITTFEFNGSDQERTRIPSELANRITASIKELLKESVGKVFFW